MNNNEEGFTLAEALREYPELKDYPELNEYGFSAESMFEMMANQLQEKTGLIAKRNNREDKFAVDFNISSKQNPDEIICYVELEADLSGCFEDDGTFMHRDLTIPWEKKKYFEREKPCFYIKFSRDFQWCYILDICSCNHLFEYSEKPRTMWNGDIIIRKFWEARSATIFNRNKPFGFHRLKIQNWLIPIAYFMKKRQTKIDGWLK